MNYLEKMKQSALNELFQMSFILILSNASSNKDAGTMTLKFVKLICLRNLLKLFINHNKSYFHFLYVYFIGIFNNKTKSDIFLSLKMVI